MQKRGIMTAILSLALVGAIGVGSTLAYMTTKPTAKHNVFTAGTALTGALKETTFDSQDYDGHAAPDFVADATSDNPKYGVNQAKLVTPGRVINKDPMVKNTSAAATGSKAWVAIKLDITGAAVAEKTTYADKLAEIEKFATINIADTWEQSATDPSIYFFKTVVAPGAETTALFTTVTIKSNVGVTAIKDFAIEVQAGLVQMNGNDGLNTLDAAKPELIKLLNPTPATPPQP